MAIPEKIKILVVDDEQQVRALLKEMLEHKGYRVYCAADGCQGLEMVRESGIGIVLCDIVMPGLDGIEFLRQVRQQNSTVQVIMITGKSDPDNCREAIKDGACGYLVKPFSLEELVNSVLLATRHISEKKQIIKEALKQLKAGKVKYILRRIEGKILFSMLLSFLFCFLLVPFLRVLPLTGVLNRVIFDQFQRVENTFRLPPEAIKDITLVVIDNKTLNEIPQRWPYPRQVFAEAINHLKQARPRVIAFDFTFMGKSSPEEDGVLKDALSQGPAVILGSAIDEKGSINFLTIPELKENTITGFVNVIQDEDGIIRRGLTYLKDEKNHSSAFLSWDLQVLRIAKGINLDTFIDNGSSISFKNAAQEKWTIPVLSDTGSFYINFRADASKFNGLSFYRVVKGDFDPEYVRDKIVLLGMNSPLLGDFHNTPIGVMPGIILKANSFLALYSHDFLKNVPKKIGLSLVFLGVILTVFSILFLKSWQSILLFPGQIIIFFIASYVLLLSGYIWNYAIFPVTLIIIYLILVVGRKILSLYI
ncbi:MAG: CHASE2 domain-containing protein [Candidatus Omnitrophota bacterium]|nr:CHASE2 domain-containing protein [Candidatus Omnitrophota bacterium]